VIQRRRAIQVSALTLAAVLSSGAARAEQRQPAAASPFQVNANVGLSSLMSIADGHIRKMADSLQVLALSDQARSANWATIERLLADAGKMNVAALNWFALPDGSYWSVQSGRVKGNLSTRSYFQKVLAGQTIMGDLLVSKATGKSVAIVAVPVKGRDGKIAGVLGASIYLDRLSERIRNEMSLPPNLIFYSFDAEPLLALVWDPGLIFTNPKQLGPEVDRAFTEMLTRNEGVVTYTFRDQVRTVAYRKSPVTAWWYALGRVEALRREAPRTVRPPERTR
jgi:hypothetical protein